MSHVYYKFKSQKDPSRVVFDGPSISVFDLKREIIQLNKLGSGSDFDLSIYDESTNEGTDVHGEAINLVEYTDDNFMIPRATSIIVRRLPPAKPGKGTAVKYVTGIVGNTRGSRNEPLTKRMNEVTAKASAPAVVASVQSTSCTGPNVQGDDESAAIAKMMSAQSANWDSQQEKMAHANPVYTHRKKLPISVPDKAPPQGYICHRCGEKGHWIQACPTNNDPQFDNKPRIKRTTGIPKTFLKKAEKPVFDEDGGEGGKTNGIMLNADGEYVVVEPDSKSWATYQAKQNAGGEADVYLQPLPAEHKDWECGICGKLVRDAVRTPCCKKLFCDQDIQSALLESDFVCPACRTDDVLLDSLVADEGVRAEVAEYVSKWEAERARSMSPPATEEDVKRETFSPPTPSRKRSRSPAPTEEATNKKVARQDDSKSPNMPKSTPPTIPPNQQFNQFQQQQQQQFNIPPFMPGIPPMPFPPFPPDPIMMATMGIPPPPMPGMMPLMLPMGPVMFPPQGYNQQGYNQGYNQGYSQGYNQMGNQLYGGENAAYMRKPTNERGMRRVQRGGGGGAGRSQADYRELI